VFLSDSGPHDRDGNSAVGGINIGTGEMLDALSTSGFAVLRLDDRGVGESGGDVARNSLSIQALDAIAQIDFLRSRPDIDAERIALLGHGEGANVAIMVAAKRPDLKALILLAPSDVPLSQLSEEQIKHRVQLENRNDPGAWERHPIIRLMRIAQKEPNREFLVFGGRSVYLDIYREWFAMQPVENLKKSQGKILHLQSDKDLQVFPRHANGFRKALGGDSRYSFKSFAGLNHFFKPSHGTIGEYADPTLKVDPKFVAYLIGWLKANL